MPFELAGRAGYAGPSRDSDLKIPKEVLISD